MFDANIPKLHGHRLAGVELQGEQAVGTAGFFVIIHEHHCLHIVDEVHEVEIFRHDAVLVPFLLFNGLANFDGVTELLGLLLQLALVVHGERGLEAAIGKDAAETFAIADARITIARLEVGLITADAPAVVSCIFLRPLQ